MPSLEALLVGLLAMAGIIVFFVGVARVFARSPHSVDDRMEHYTARAGGATVGAQSSGGGRVRGRFTRDLDRVMLRRGRGVDLSIELARADLRLTPGEYVVLIGTSVVVAFGLGLIIFRVWYVAVPCAILGYFAPRWYLAWRQFRRRAAFSAQLPEAIGLLSTSLRSGYSLLQSMDLLSRETPPPICDEFARVVREIGLGVAFEEAVSNMRRRINNEDLDILVTVLLIQHEVGGNLAVILDTVNHTIRERIRIKGEIRILTAQQQASGYFVGSMPFLLTILLFIISPSYMGQLFTNLCGQGIFATTILLVTMALLIIRRIVTIEV